MDDLGPRAHSARPFWCTIGGLMAVVGIAAGVLLLYRELGPARVLGYVAVGVVTYGIPILWWLRRRARPVLERMRTPRA